MPIQDLDIQKKILQGESGSNEVAIFGFDIPYIPDFLLDHTLLGNTDILRLEEILNRFERFVIGLRKYHGSAYSLRFFSNPSRGEINLSFLCRMLRAPGLDDAPIHQFLTDIDAHLTSFGIPHHPFIRTTDEKLRSTINPFASRFTIVETRQKELLVPLITVNKEAYVIHPYWKARGPLLEPFEVMLRQNSPVMVSIYLQPTELFTDEYKALSEASYLAQTVADMDAPVQSTTGIRRRRDPGADLVGRIYSKYLQSLDEPFITLVQTVSDDPNSAWTVARSFSSNITDAYNTSDSAQSGESLPSGIDLHTPMNADEYNKARQTHENLMWIPWGASQASLHKERIPYLCGAKGASSAFRFPISIRGGIPGIIVRQLPPDFDPGYRPQKSTDRQIQIGKLQRGGDALSDVRDLSRHVLITGFTGSGKTNTVLYLLDQLWKKHHIPFIVIEAAKKEYRALSNVQGFEDLLIFTLGDETTSPFRLNPFEIMPGLRLEAHLGHLQACFDAALPQFGILPSIISEAMENIYKTRNWRLTDRATIDETRLFPTMRDMFTEVIRVAENRGYAGETYHNIRAAAAGRIGGLLRGSKGRMFGCQKSFPADILFSRPVILELNDLNEDDKALTMMYLLTWIREYRELHPSNLLQHLTVVEEAHNVLSNTQSIGNTEVAADTKAKSVGAFCNMLSEIRAYGEGIIISDQSPEKLAPDAMRNTNLQIAHQLRDQKDRQAIARSMIMDDSQSEFLGKLRVGEAALFQTGLERATFIKVPEYKDSAGFLKIPDDDDIHNRMIHLTKDYLIQSLPYNGCKFCKYPCQFREAIEPQTLDKELHEELSKALFNFNVNPDPDCWPQNWASVTKVCAIAGKNGGHAESIDAAFCYFAHEIDFEFTPHMRNMFENAFPK